jgi:transcriptional regulator GlxA family with amidase domain
MSKATSAPKLPLNEILIEPFLSPSKLSPAAPPSSDGTAGRRAAANGGATISEARDRRIREVLALIQNGPASSVGELADKVRLSRGQLQRLFKRQTGAHISDFLVEQRLQRAAHLLAVSNLSIKEIAYTVGYEHHSSFTRAFANRFAQSPKDYRQKSDGAEC